MVALKNLKTIPDKRYVTEFTNHQKNTPFIPKSRKEKRDQDVRSSSGCRGNRSGKMIIQIK